MKLPLSLLCSTPNKSTSAAPQTLHPLGPPPSFLHYLNFAAIFSRIQHMDSILLFKCICEGEECPCKEQYTSIRDIHEIIP